MKWKKEMKIINGQNPNLLNLKCKLFFTETVCDR